MRSFLEKAPLTPWIGLLVNLGICLLTYLTWSAIPYGSTVHIGMQWLAFVFLSAVGGIMVLSFAVADCLLRRWWGLLALPLAATPYFLCMIISNNMIAAKALYSDM